MTTISGQDYPIRPLAQIERDLAAASYDGYVQGVEVPRPPWTRRPADEFSRRYHYRYRRIRPPGPRLRRAIRAARPVLELRDMPWGTLLGRRCATPFSPALLCRAGSDWLTLSRPCVEAVAAAAGSRPDLLRHYRRALLPTESFAHTVLHATPGLRLSGDPGASPRGRRVPHIPTCSGWPTSSGCSAPARTSRASSTCESTPPSSTSSTA